MSSWEKEQARLLKLYEEMCGSSSNESESDADSAENNSSGDGQKVDRGGGKGYIWKRKESDKIAGTEKKGRKDEGRRQKYLKDRRKRKPRNGGDKRPDQKDDEKDG
ncbi:hypothetical protein FQA39_LY10663 [Lamprigera yunnana]|nr:hypothetical protein FQA39_LY10663 [Lamprigera yunnana]